MGCARERPATIATIDPRFPPRFRIFFETLGASLSRPDHPCHREPFACLLGCVPAWPHLAPTGIILTGCALFRRRSCIVLARIGHRFRTVFASICVVLAPQAIQVYPMGGGEAAANGLDAPFV